MKAECELRVFILYLTFIAAAEVATSFYDPSYDLLIHSVIFASPSIVGSFDEGSQLSFEWYLVVGVSVVAVTLTMMGGSRHRVKGCRSHV
jgi:hypothetical protein